MAQDISGTSLATNVEDDKRDVDFTVEVQWNGTDWVDETANVKSLSWSEAFAPPEESVIRPGGGFANEATLTLFNNDARYSPYNTGSAIAANIDDGRYYLTAVRVKAGFESELLTVFTGYIFDADFTSRKNEVTFTLRDRSATILEVKGTTEMKEGISTDAWLVILCGLVSIAGGDQVFDKGTVILPFAWLDDESVWEQMALAAAAEGGWVYFDWGGKLHFENGAHWANHDTSIYTFDRDHYSDLQPQHRPDEVYNEVTVEYSPRVEGAAQDLWNLERPITIGPSGTFDLVARLQLPATAIYTPTESYDFSAALVTGDNSDGDLSISGESKYGQRYECTLTNDNANHSIIVTKFRVRGVPILGEPSEEITATGVATFVTQTRNLPVRANVLVQTSAQASALANFLVDRYQNPRHLMSISGAPAVPWLELGDRVTVQEPDHFTGGYSDRIGFIVSKSFHLGHGQPFTMDAEVIGLGGMLQSTDYFLLDTHKWGTGAGSGYLWYGGTVEESWTEVPDVATGDILSAHYLATLAANLNYVHGLLMGHEHVTAWYFGSDGTAPNTTIFEGAIWHQYRYLRYDCVVAGGETIQINVNSTLVATATPGAPNGVADLNALGLSTGTFYDVDCVASGSGCYINELAQQGDSAVSPTEPTFPTFTDGAVSDYADLNLIKDGIAWIKDRAAQPQLPHIARLKSQRPGAWTEDEFVDNYILNFRGTVRHRFNTLAWKTIYHPANFSNKGKMQIRIRVDSASAGQYYDTKEKGEAYDDLTETGTITSLSGLSALDLALVEVYCRHELTTLTEKLPPTVDYPDWQENTIQYGDDNSAFGAVFMYETSANAKIVSWTALPAWAHKDQPAKTALDKFKTDGDLLKVVARYANRPTPKLNRAFVSGEKMIQGVQMLHRWRWFHYQTRYETRSGSPEAESVTIKWGDNETALPDSGEDTFVIYDLEQVSWLTQGAIYEIRNAVYVLETPTAS